MADSQLGAYAAFSGLNDSDVATYAEKGMMVRAAPPATGFEWDAHRYERAVAAVNHLEPDFVVMGGDMVDDPRSEGEFAEVMRITGLLRPDIPVHWVPGNHDIAFDTVVPTAESVNLYRQRFGAEAYSFHRGLASFIVANSTIWGHSEELPDAWDEGMAFLEAELEGATRRGSAHIIVFAHQPLFTTSVDEEDSYWNIAPEPRSRVLELLCSYGVRAVFSGHWHRNGGGMAGNVEVVVSGPVGYPLGPDPSGLRLVEIGSDALRHCYLPLSRFD